MTGRLQSALRFFCGHVRPVLITPLTPQRSSEAPLFLRPDGRGVRRFYISRCLTRLGQQHGVRHLTAQRLRAVQHSLLLAGNPHDRRQHEFLSRDQNHTSRVALNDYVRTGQRPADIERIWEENDGPLGAILFDQFDNDQDVSENDDTDALGDPPDADENAGRKSPSVDGDLQDEGSDGDAVDAGDRSPQQLSSLATEYQFELPAVRIKCPLCSKEMLRRYIGQHLGRNGCVKIPRAQERMCVKCGTIFYDSAALAKHTAGPKACRERVIGLENTPDKGAAILAAAAERLNTKRATVLQRQNELIAKGMELLSRS